MAMMDSATMGTTLANAHETQTAIISETAMPRKAIVASSRWNCRPSHTSTHSWAHRGSRSIGPPATCAAESSSGGPISACIGFGPMVASRKEGRCTLLTEVARGTEAQGRPFLDGFPAGSVILIITALVRTAYGTVGCTREYDSGRQVTAPAI